MLSCPNGHAPTSRHLPRPPPVATGPCVCVLAHTMHAMLCMRQGVVRMCAAPSVSRRSVWRVKAGRDLHDEVACNVVPRHPRPRMMRVRALWELLSTRGRTRRSRGSNQPPNSPRCWRPRQRRAERAKMGKPSGKAKGAKPPVLLVCTHACAQRTPCWTSPDASRLLAGAGRCSCLGAHHARRPLHEGG